MSSQLPPDVIIFPGIDYNSSFYTSNIDNLTYEEASKKFLKYPIAQGTESLQAINVNGVATFNQNITVAADKGITQSGGCYITQNSITGNFENTFRPSNFTGGFNVKPTSLIPQPAMALYGTYGSNSRMYYQASSLCKYLQQVSRVSPSDPDSELTIRTANTSGNIFDMVINPTNVSIQQPIISTATIPASTDNSTRVPTTAWVQSLAKNLTPNSITITPTSYPSAGITNVYNSGAISCRTSSTTVAFGSQFTPNFMTSIIFNSDNINFGLLARPCEFRVNCFFYDTDNNYGQTSFNIIIFPSAIRANWGTYQGTTYNINNKINTDGSFGYTNATYAPYGRQYWTYNQQFSGVNGANAYLYGNDVSTATNSAFSVNLEFVFNKQLTTYSITIEALSTDAAKAANLGVQISA